MNINDWKIIQMRNDVKYIKNSTKNSEASNLSLVIDLILVLVAIVIERACDDSEKLNIMWIIITTSGIIIPAILFAIQYYKSKVSEKISRKVISSDMLINMFDDEMCYAIMSAETFNKNLQSMSVFKTKQDAFMLEFYFIEASYYLRKSVHYILKMENNLNALLAESYDIRKHLSKHRLINAIRLIAAIYDELFEFEETHAKKLTSFSISLDVESAKSCYLSLYNFTKNNYELGIDLKEVFKNV